MASKRTGNAAALPEALTTLPELLLAWYDRHARTLAWRVGPAERAAGVRADPYRVWLSEVMLQQTTIAHATRYFEAFTARWPDVGALAAAADEDVMAAWAGLGYYARARNLLKCARVVAAAGGFPATEEGLRALPGIGAYTAGAVAAIAFEVPAPAVDGNVERVMARLLALEGDWAAGRRRIAQHVRALVPAGRPGAFAEALMDLGATLCTPKRPDCAACPVSGLCAARAAGAAAAYPKKPKRAEKPLRYGHVEVALAGGRVRLERRPPEGLLGGMLGLPGSAWREGGAAETAPASAGWQAVGEVGHVFTHFALRLTVYQRDEGEPEGGEWRDIAEADAALPSVFRKALRLAVGGNRPSPGPFPGGSADAAGQSGQACRRRPHSARRSSHCRQAPS